MFACPYEFFRHIFEQEVVTDFNHFTLNAVLLTRLNKISCHEARFRNEFVEKFTLESIIVCDITPKSLNVIKIIIATISNDIFSSTFM